VASPQFTFSQDANGSYASAVFTVVSKEQTAISVVPRIEGLPAGWSYQFSPANAILTPGQSANFTANLTISSYESGKDYTATLVLASGSAESRTPFVVPLATASPFTGFFTLGSVENAAVLVLLAMAAFAGFYYYKARELEQEESAPAKESAPTPEAAPL